VGEMTDPELAAIEAKAYSVVEKASETLKAQGARLSTWLVLGNGAALAFTLNAAFNGRCSPSMLWGVALFFVIGMAFGFGAVAASYISSLISLLTMMPLHRQIQDARLGKPVTPPKPVTGIMPLPNLILTVISYVALAISTLAFALGMSAPVRYGPAAFEACAAAKPQPPTPARPGSVRPRT
jgi:hypothetical protein